MILNSWLKINDTSLMHNLAYVKDKCNSYNVRLFFNTTALSDRDICRVMRKIRSEYGSKYVGHADVRARVLYYEDMMECMFLTPNQILPFRNNEYFQQYSKGRNTTSLPSETGRTVWKLCTDLNYINDQQQYHATYHSELPFQHLMIGVELGGCREGVPENKLHEFPVEDNMLFVSYGYLENPILQDMVRLSKIIKQHQPSHVCFGTSAIYERLAIFKHFLDEFPDSILCADKIILLGHTESCMLHEELKQDVCRIEMRVLECYSKELPQYFQEHMFKCGISKTRWQIAKEYPFNILVDAPFPMLESASPIDGYKDTLMVLGGNSNFSIVRSKVQIPVNDIVSFNLKDYNALVLHGLLA